MFEIRAIEETEVNAFRDVMITSFGDDAESDPDGERRFRNLVEHGRAWMAFDGRVPVATAAAYAMELGIPGGTMPIAGLTMVSVRPSHRRRGILTAMIDRFFADARAHDAALFGLWASEATIYGRFGFGVAAEGDTLELDHRGLAIAAIGEHDGCQYVDEIEAREVLPPIYARAIADRPGALHRTPTWWRERRFLESPLSRGGRSRRRYVVARRDGEAVGYVVFRQGDLHDTTTGGKTSIVELVGVDPRAEASLWHLIAGIDLFPRSTWEYAPVDSVLPWIASNSRRLVRKREDTLWLRIDDVARTLAARRYAGDGEIRIVVEGEEHGLVVKNGSRTNTSTSASTTTVEMTRAALSSIFLGGIRAAALGRAGWITGDVELLDRMFAWPVAPWCPEVF